MFKMLMFTFGCVILWIVNVLNRFIKGYFFGIATLKQSVNKQSSGGLCIILNYITDDYIFFNSSIGFILAVNKLFGN